MTEKSDLLDRARVLGLDDLDEQNTVREIRERVTARELDVERAAAADGPSLLEQGPPADGVVPPEDDGDPEREAAPADPPAADAVPDDARELTEKDGEPALLCPPGLRLRAPTGVAAYPVVLVEGDEKGGKTFALAQLSASPRVGATFAFDLAGDGTLDEYGPLGPYRIVETNGTFGDFYQQLKLAASVPPVNPGRPNVIGIDSMTSLWALICAWLDGKARGREKNRKLLERDPDAEVQITNDLWNLGKDRWRDVMNVLMSYPGIVVLTARGKEVSVVDAQGQPTRDKTWRVEAEKTLTWDCTAWVRVERSRPPRLNAVRSLTVDLPAEGMLLPRANALDYLVFDVLGAGVEFGTRTSAAPEVGIAAVDAKKRLLAFLAAQGVNEDLAVQRAGHAWRMAGLEGKAEITNAEYAEVLRVVTTESEGSTVDKAAPDAPRGDAPAEEVAS